MFTNTFARPLVLVSGDHRYDDASLSLPTPPPLCSSLTSGKHFALILPLTCLEHIDWIFQPDIGVAIPVIASVAAAHSVEDTSVLVATGALHVDASEALSGG